MSFSDPRGPRRTIVAADNSSPSHWLLTLDCGHIQQGTRHFWFKVGDTFHCLACRKP